MEYKNRLLASDIEAVGFYDKVHTKKDIHCLCSIDIETEGVLLFHDHPEFDNVEVTDPYDNKTYTIPARVGTLDEGIKFWEKAVANGSKLIIHNAYGYDKHVIDKIWPDNTIKRKDYHDTFVQSKVQWFERPTPKGAKSPHGLKAYGIKCGVNKPEITDWTTIDAFKMHRVIEDCKIQASCYLMLEKEASLLKERYGVDFSVALDIEGQYAIECFRQEQNGVKIDIEHARRCIKDLDEKLEILRKEIEPQLPPTIKGSTPKISRREMSELFGFDSSRVREKWIKKKKDGEVVDVIEKPFHKPTVKYYNTQKHKAWKAEHSTLGRVPSFDTKKEVTDVIKRKHGDTKGWNIYKEEWETKVLNQNTCNHFDLEPEDTDIVCGAFTRISIEPSKLTQHEVVKGFLIKLGWKEAEEWNLKTDVNDNYIKVEEDTEVRWPRKAHYDNQLVKIVKKGEYLVSSPKLTDDDYEQLPEGLGKKIAEYNTYKHRRNFLENFKDPENKGILSYVREDGRIPAGVNNFATRSGRSSHRVWVNAPSESALYGKEIRSCIIAEEGNVLVGIDMKSAQLSIAAYYANNWDYYNNVAAGMEFDEDGKYVGETAHCVNTRMLGMVSDEDWREAVRTQDHTLIEKLSLKRKKSKGGSFSIIFGASGAKVGKTVGISERDGAKAKEKFLEQMGLDTVIDVLKYYEKTYKYGGGFMLPLAFGYWLWNNSSHKSFNTIDQGFEALAQKLATIKLSKDVKKLGLSDKMKIVCSVHDELLLEVEKGYEDEAGKLTGDAYTWSAKQIYLYHKKRPDHFANEEPPQFAIDLNGGYKTGKTYYDCH
ncbi:DNA polymerase I [Alteromonas phage vB_AmeM_PT11-V22]|uniref:DNA polymerase I n=1 Tax=Alteromonas phage vB_AmeM_PT11-V22 TaxID=2704031 RepID=A0A6C0R1Y4_9CAUD|nr:DNA polymerase I [Alteromonas phage vB_AmeM_PT11-V22]QHZ59827.1 DNA polymerase I [Alteromonas phage vB_AmeM_PT11-V22]